MLARFGLTLSLATLVSASLVGASASADPVPTSGSPSAPHATAGFKVPWGSDVARFVPGHVVVVWKDQAARRATRALNARLGARTIAPMAGSNVDVVQIGTGTSVSAAIRRYRRSPLVRFAEPDRIATISAIPPITNDPLVGQQWSLNNAGQLHELTHQLRGGRSTRKGTADADVDAPEAWAARTSVGQHPVIAVIDTGVATNHPDLQNQLWVNAIEQSGTPGVDDDGNGFIDDVHGWDFVGNDRNPSPMGPSIDNSHGTHVAGIIAAEQDNGEGISGVCPGCRIMALRIGTAASITLGNELKAINYAIRKHADVINLSLGDPVWSKAERAAIARAGKAGILVVVAAGNSSMDNDIQFYEHPKGQPPSWAPSYPASYTLRNILAVAASNDRDQYAYFSQCQGRVPLWECGFTSWGHDSVDVAAPGVDIMSTVAVGRGPLAHPGYVVWDGTSMAAPMVAGIAGLVRSEHPNDTAAGIKNAIMRSVNRPASLRLYDAWGPQAGVGKKLLTGHFTRTQGRVNALRALGGSTANATPLTDGNIDGAKLFTSPKVGHLAWPADANDVYKRKLRKGIRYQVILNGPSGSDMDLWVWRPGTTEIFQFTSGCFFRGGACPALQAVSGGRRADEKVTFRAPRTGVFYIQVNGWYSGGRYTLTMHKV